MKVGTAQIELDSASIISEDELELVLPGILAREGVLKYSQGRAYRAADELQKSLFTFEGAWVVSGKHPTTWVLMDPTLIGGRVDNVEWDSNKNVIRGKVHLLKAKVSADFLEAVKTGVLRQNSIGFMYEEDWTPGEFNGEKYDFIQRKILVDHIAVGVAFPRDPGCKLGVDSLESSGSVDFSVKSDVQPRAEPIIKNLDPELTLQNSRRILNFYGNMPQGRTVLQNGAEMMGLATTTGRYK